MSKSNPLVGLISYGDSDESDDDLSSKPVHQMQLPPNPGVVAQEPNAAVHPAPIPHCAWSACYDEGSGFTYYWNQHTNAVTWEAPQEYLMALKLAQHQLNASGSTEVSAEEWQLYQQALADKQKPGAKTKAKPAKPAEKPGQRNGAKRKVGSDDENERIELIDSYHNSDSESNDEESPVKSVKPAIPKPPVVSKNPHKKQKTKPPVEYGPSLPANQNYTVPIGPELPPGMVVEIEPKIPTVVAKEEKEKKSAKIENDDSQDESVLFKRLKDKAKLLEKLGGEIPTELQKMIQDEPKNSSPKLVDETSRDKLDIDDLLSEIEQNELPKIKSKKVDIFGEELSNSGKCTPTGTPPRELKPLFPSSKVIEETPQPPLPPANVENGIDKALTETEKKQVNVYLADSEVKENRKKLRIDNSLLPDRKKREVPAYTTKYSQFIEGFSSERTGLGFKEDEESHSPKTSTISYGNGLTFTKGEVLNEEKRDEDLDEMAELVEAKLKFLNEVQPCAVGPVQEMLIQFQTLVTAFRSGALAASYWRRWVAAGELSLRGLERRAAPTGWTCAFQRSEGRYRYRRESDGLTQWEYPAAAHCDMEICTTPPPEEPKAVSEPPPLPPLPPLPPPPVGATARAATPPPPAWHDPPPPGCDDPPPLPPEPKKEIGDELLSFYSDIAQLENTSAPHTATSSPEPPPPPEIVREAVLIDREAEREIEKEKDTKIAKKKSKVKISASIGLKHKTVSSMVAKWQQVADEIHSD